MIVFISIIIVSLLLALLFFKLGIIFLCGIFVGMAVVVLVELIAFWIAENKDKRNGHDKFA